MGFKSIRNLGAAVTLWLLAMAGALWVVLPVYIANGTAPFSRGKGPRMDLGRTWAKDGLPLLGTSKTWLGFLIGGTLGLLVGLFEEYLLLLAPPSLQFVPFFAPNLAAAILPIAVLSYGAMAGDALGSFVKRRKGTQSGGRSPFLDQLPFILLPMILIEIFFPQLFLAAFWPEVATGILLVGWVLILSLFLHASFNILGYFVGLKKVPW
jgi:CDP-2,3-bis-(O-geranylgeranyl)-sn-glycerol synthase